VTRKLRHSLAAGCAAGLTLAAAVSLAAARQVIVMNGSPEPAAEPARGTAVISGVVVDASTEAPISDALVSLTGRGVGSFRQLTDSKGRFIFSQLPASDGYSSLRASKPGYFDGTYGAVNRMSGKPIVLAESQWFQNARIEMVRPSAITGTVLDERGEPVVAAYVRVLAQLTAAGVPHLAVGVSGKTDDRGIYRLAGLSAGRYVVEVASVQTAVPAGTSAATVAGMSEAAGSSGRPVPAYQAIDLDATTRLVVGNHPLVPPAGPQPRTYPIVFYPNALGLPEATTIELGAGEERSGIDLQLRPVPAWRVSGRVDGPPAATAGLRLRLVPPGLEDLGVGSEAAAALVGKDGTFEFLNVPAGRYTIDARRSFTELRYGTNDVSNRPSLPAPGFISTSGGGGTIFSAPAGTSYAYANGEGDANWWAQQPIEVSNADVTGLVVTMRHAVSLSGRLVVQRRVADTPAEPQGRNGPPVAFLMLEPADGSASLGMHTARPDPDTLAFTISGLLPGKYIIQTLGAGAVTSIAWNGRDYTYAPFDTSSGEDITNVTITIDPSGKPATIAGSVPDVATRPHGAAVIAFPVEPAEWTNYGFRPSRFGRAAVADNGSYHLTVPAGEYYVVAVDGDRINAWQDPRFLQAAAASAVRVAVDWNQTRNQPLTIVEVRP
jgi:hypothetical protein